MMAALAILLALALAAATVQSLVAAPLSASWAGWLAGELYGSVALLVYGVALALLPAPIALGYYLVLCAVLWSSARQLQRFLARLAGPDRAAVTASLLLGLPLAETMAPWLWQHLLQRAGYFGSGLWPGAGITAAFWFIWLGLGAVLLPLDWVIGALAANLLAYAICFSFSALLVVQFWLSQRRFPRVRPSHLPT